MKSAGSSESYGSISWDGASERTPNRIRHRSGDIRLYLLSSNSSVVGEAVSASSTCVAWMVKGEGNIDRALNYANQLKKTQILVREPIRWFAVTG